MSEPIVADVHTDAENGLALEVGTGHPGLTIVVIDNQGDVSLYGGLWRATSPSTYGSTSA